MTDESRLRTLAKELFDELLGELARAQAKLADAGSGPLDAVGNWWRDIDESWFDQQRGVLNAAGVTLARMEPSSPGELAAKLYAGGISWERFLAIGKQVRDNVAAVLAALDSTYRSGRVWDEVFRPTVDRVSDVVGKTVDQTFDALPFVSVAAVALVVGYLVFTFRR